MRSPITLSEGFSLSIRSAVTGEREAKVFFMSFLCVEVADAACGCDMGAGALGGVGRRDELEDFPEDRSFDDLCFSFSALISSFDGFGGSTSR